MKLKVELNNVYKSFLMRGNQYEKLLELFSIQKKHKKNQKEFLAVRNLTFKVYEGESVGIIGLNGSGKSTLSNLLAQVIQPTSGNINIDGETSLIAISAGLNNNLSGYDNIEQKCMMHGIPKENIEKLKPEIIEFADIGDYIYQPVKNYSSGMRSRLGFAIAVHTDPDILIIDEALSVGDSTFADKSLQKMNEFKKRGKTLFFVSHSAAQVRKFCDKALWIHYGELKAFGETDEVAKQYQDFVTWFNQLPQIEKNNYKREQLASQKVPYIKNKSKLQKETNSSSEWVINLFVALPVLVLGLLVVLGW
ncbi:ABC transporter ATP-binding protein [Saliterribacillus persicus]|uniref:Teichoic acid transport system ATP-binding protein n=1 Tax=Saliterribacillus persicus TaxID=930114 RepID=A0A368YGT7_9BACI|nr:ABC transporter ATP-binding protein [Saliterribacillus persicus]RCW77404.1 teichoic acid transport system ATP-binding protein [Saliterribacillus persicus]